MKNSKALKLLAKIQDDLSRNGIITNTLVADLQDLRPYAVEDKNPLLAKTIRLTFEHIEANQTFAIAIPDDEPIEGIEFTAASEEVDAKESLAYLLHCLQIQIKIKRIGFKRVLQCFNCLC